MCKYKICKYLYFQVSYQAIASYLVEEKGYDSDLLKPFDPDFWLLCYNLYYYSKENLCCFYAFFLWLKCECAVVRVE